jgi:Tfp pilus assembly protein PilF
MLFAAALALTACGGTIEPAPTPVATTAPATPVPESANAEANTLFMEARAKGLDRSREGITGAIALLEKAVRLDGTFARAYAELALALGTLDDATDPLVRRPRAKVAAERAVALNGSSAAALTALAFVRYRFDWQWTGADAVFAKAIAANPNDAFARHQYGVFLAALGRTDDALRELGRAVELDPGSAAVRADLVAPLLRAGRVAEARAAINTFAAAVSSGPLLHQLESDVLAAEGRMDESVESLWKALAARGVSAGRVKDLRAAYQSGGVTMMIERRIRQLTAEVENGPSPPASYRLATDLALAHASLKHRDQTLHWLAVAIDLHEDAPLYMRSSSSFDFVRDEPQFKELLRRAKLDGVSRP